MINQENNIFITTIKWCGLLIIGMGLLALVGWSANWLKLASFYDIYIPMAPSTSVCFILTGNILLVRLYGSRQSFLRHFELPAVISVLVFCLTPLLGQILGQSLDLINVLFVPANVWTQAQAGIMSPITAVLFAIGGGAIICLRFGRNALAAVLGAMIFIAGFVFSLGYLYKAPFFYGGSLVPVALPTTLAFLALGIGLACLAGPAYWPLKPFLERSTSALLFRVIFPLIFVIILLSDWFLTREIPRTSVDVLRIFGFITMASLLLVYFLVRSISHYLGRTIDASNLEVLNAEKALRATEQQFRTLVDNLDSVVYRCEVKTPWRTFFISESIQRLSGKSAAEFFSNSIGFAQIIHPEDLPQVEKGVSGAVAEKRPFDLEYRIIHTDGTIRWVHERGRAIYDSDGAPVFLDGVLLDITSKKAIETDYINLFNQMLDGFAVHQIILDEKGETAGFRFLAVNPVIEQMTGLRAADIIGKSVFEIFPNIDKTWIDKYGQVALTGEPCRFEQYYKDMNRHFEVVAFSPQKGIVAAIIKDVTENKQAAQQIKYNNEITKVSYLLLKSSLEEIPLSNLLAQGLHLILEAPFLPPNTRGGIFLVREGTLHLVVDHHLDPHVTTECCQVPLGKCFCGQVAESRDPQYISYCDANHAGVKNPLPHAHFAMPIVANNETLGVLCLYLEPGHPPEPNEINFLTAMTNTIAAIIDHKRDEERVRELSSRNTAILAAIPDIIMEVNSEKLYTWANQSGYDFFGDDVIGKPASYYFLGEQETYQLVRPLFNGNQSVVHVESWQKRKDGARRLLAWTCKPLTDANGEITGALSSARDITDVRLLEERLHQSEKMEAIGQLAGGVAHDFNNQLLAIMGYADLLRLKLEDPTLTEYADSIVRASERAAALTKQLLAFARKGKYLSTPVNIHKIIGEVHDLIIRSLDKRIRVKQHLEASPCIVTGDPAQLNNALLNLAINAGHAMPQGGELIFQTQNVFIDADSPRRLPDIQPGNYISIRVTDTGVGMDKDIQNKIFEPFFTTKKEGEGTGLGLASVYGAVKNHHGFINVYSEPGHGTTFSIYLPLAEGTEAELAATKAATAATKGSGRILLVDDEEIVRKFGADILADLGYSVVLCNNGREAVEYYRTHHAEFDLVILDMIMPEMGGRDAFIEIQKINPAVKCLLASGYSLNGAAQKILELGVKAFIQKPFRITELSEVIAETLRSPA